MKKMLRLIKLFSDESRLRILLLLEKKELCVCQLMGVLNMSQPLVSRNLSLLAKAGFLDDRREGKLMFYRIRKDLPKRHAALLSLLNELLKSDRMLMRDLSTLAECEEFQKKTGRCDMRTLTAFRNRKKRAGGTNVPGKQGTNMGAYMKEWKRGTRIIAVAAFSAALSLASLALFIKDARAEEQRLDLRAAVVSAMENNYELKAYKSVVASGREDIGIARSYLLPKVTFEERFLRTDNPTYAFMAKLNQERFTQSDFGIDSLNNPRPINDFQTSLSFEQPLFSRKANIGLAMAKTESSALSEDYTRKKEEVAAKVARTYFIVLTAREYLKTAEQALNDSKEHRHVADVRHKSGLGLYSDTLRASTAVIEAEQRLVSARKNLNVAKRALALLLGLNEPVDASEETFEMPVMDFSYYDNAAASRKDVRSLETRYENAKNNIKLAESGYFPTVGIGGSYQLNDHRMPGSEGDSWQLMAFLRWELFDGAKRGHEKAKARHKAAETGENLRGLKNAVSFQVYESYQAVEEARKNTELAASAVKTAEEGKRLVRVRYENSLSPLVDLLDAQVSLDHARAGLVARENEYRTAVADLGFESGTILRDLKIEE